MRNIPCRNDHMTVRIEHPFCKMFMTVLQLILQVSGNDKCLTVAYDILYVNESLYGCHGYRFAILSMR